MSHCGKSINSFDIFFIHCSTNSKHCASIIAAFLNTEWLNYDKSYLPFVETTTPAPMPRRPLLLPLSELILRGSKVPCACRRPQPKIIEPLFAIKLCRSLPHPALGPISGADPPAAAEGATAPEPPPAAEQPA
jgi:hypothetical protein